MQQLLDSRLNRDESPTKLQNLSPEKYGKAAFAGLNFTPSKLADNVLYRQVTTMKKYEEGTSKLRQFQALNNVFKDKISQVEEERDGIQQSLTQQISMYKKMLQEMETKNQMRIKNIQKSFNTEIHKIIQAKEEEAKYAQSEKQLLQAKIQQLQAELNAFKDQLSNTGNQLDDLKNQHEKLEIRTANLEQKLGETEERRREQNERSKKQYEILSRKLYTTEVESKKQLDNAINIKNKEIQNLQRFHKTELQKVQNQRCNESLLKNQQIKDLRNTFDSQAKRLNEIVNMKDRMVDSLTKQNNKEKNTILEITRKYQNQINNLSHQKSRLLQEIEEISKQNSELNFTIKDLQNNFLREKENLQNYIEQLRQQLQMNQVNFVRERDRLVMMERQMAGQISRQRVQNDREIGLLRMQNDRIISLSQENQMLCREVKNLRDLLLQSSMEMDRCKEEFLKMGCEKDQLLIKLRELGFQNNTLQRIKMEREEEARGWKDSYFLHRMHK